MSKVKLRMGDRVRIPNDEHVHIVIGIDDYPGLALLQRSSPNAKIFWLSVDSCEVVRCSQ